MPRLGQHFLNSDPLLARIIQAAEIEHGDRVLEIGPGQGQLTRKLLAAGAQVVAIELDDRLATELERGLASEPAFHLLRGDAARVPWPHFDKLVSNLPYEISSPVLFRLLDTDHALAVLTLQEEFADRLVARPATKDYSRLTVKTALKANAKSLFKIPRTAFSPPPGVGSVCVRITPREPPDILDWHLLGRLLDTSFDHRRKMLRASLKGEPHALEVLAALGWGARRPEELPPMEWVQLANAVWRARLEP